jgi:hypothetical protein
MYFQRLLLLEQAIDLLHLNKLSTCYDVCTCIVALRLIIHRGAIDFHDVGLCREHDRVEFDPLR